MGRDVFYNKVNFSLTVEFSTTVMDTTEVPIAFSMASRFASSRAFYFTGQ
ncbi:MAG: hypothetical protein U9N60_09960 [Thermodesulfobacteriota bacterium]|nr:hypothetical protein [Thermodesulfobacteriota bacterium]